MKRLSVMSLLATLGACTASERAPTSPNGVAGDSLVVAYARTSLPVVALALTSAPADTSTGHPISSGKALPTIVVSLRNASNRSVAQSRVSMSATLVSVGGAPIAGATLTGAGPVGTDANGNARFTALTASAKVGVARIVFSSNGLTPTSLLISVTPGALSPAASTLRLSSDSVNVGSTITGTVTAKDAAGNKLGAGHTIVLRSAGGTSLGTWSAASFNSADSTYAATFTGTSAGSSTSVSATVDGVSVAAALPLTVRAGVPTGAAPDVTFSVNTSASYPISRFIYGANFASDAGSWGSAVPAGDLTFSRMGGNRLSAYNWENGYSNAGSDWYFNNDRYMQPNSTAPGDAVRSQAQSAFSRGQAFMATIPMLGYVAGDACGCNVGTSDLDRAQRLATHFKISKASKGAPLLATPDLNDAYVYQDEFVAWFDNAFPGHSTNATAPIFFSLDNEPDIWNGTHKEIQSDLNDNPATPRLLTYSGISDTSIVYARAIKNVLPGALVFGPAVATYTGVSVAGRYPSPDPVYGFGNFFDVYLDRMRAAQATYGRRLLDALDLHWYPAASAGAYEITNDYAPQDSANIEARIQAPRSLWDPTYTERSWVVDVTGGPIQLLPRLRGQIAAHYPGTKISISEYYYGRGGDISGGIAQADVLGIFGREGVFAAALWPNAGIWAAPYNGDANKAYAYVFGAFRMFLNYDGAGGRFGDTGLEATTSNAQASSVYASRDALGRTVIVAINKARTAKRAAIVVQGASGVNKAAVWALTGASALPVRQPDVPFSTSTSLTYTMPAMSVTTLVLTP